jgi:hypothetical protein
VAVTCLVFVAESASKVWEVAKVNHEYQKRKRKRKKSGGGETVILCHAFIFHTKTGDRLLIVMHTPLIVPPVCFRAAFPHFFFFFFGFNQSFSVSDFLCDKRSKNI